MPLVKLTASVEAGLLNLLFVVWFMTGHSLALFLNLRVCPLRLRLGWCLAEAEEGCEIPAQPVRTGVHGS
jgi:hypothetical protein